VLALSFFRQLDSDAADESLAGQAVKCLVFLAPRMHEDDATAGKLPPPLRLAGAGAEQAPAQGPASNGHAANGTGPHASDEDSGDEAEQAEGGESDPADGDEQQQRRQQGPDSQGPDVDAGSDSEGDEDGDAAEGGAGAAAEAGAEGGLTLQGLVRRMARLADDRSYARQLQRGIALRFVAAVASRLGAERVGPYLPLLVRPLYRVTEPGERLNLAGFVHTCGRQSLACSWGGSLQRIIAHLALTC
jgi:U3 small nucleolar RNA-associated protein 20